jgi:catechol 2,3-dioxygenase-like lactoylglutathione lyase family enzyme
MSSVQSSKPVLLSVAPRCFVGDLPRALAFYQQLGFETTYDDGNFAIVEREGVALHFHDGSSEPSISHSVWWIEVTNIDALYQEYLPTQAVQSQPTSQPWGFKEFLVCDPFRNLLLFAERLPEEEANSEHGI